MEILEVKTKKELKKFIDFPYSLYAKDPLYVPTLKREVREQLTEKNPFFQHAEARYFVAEDSGKTIGRIASIINKRHREFHHEETGFFGFFESVKGKSVRFGIGPFIPTRRRKWRKRAHAGNRYTSSQEWENRACPVRTRTVFT